VKEPYVTAVVVAAASELVALEREVGGLMAQSAAAEAKKATLDMQVGPMSQAATMQAVWL